MKHITSMLFATNNAHKLNEVRQLFTPYHVTILSLEDLNIDSNPEEDGDTFADNAFIKVMALASKTNLPIIADDSGLEILALDGFPGVLSARFMSNEDYKLKCHAIIEKLQSHSDKRAAFTCALAFYVPDQLTHIFYGQCPGLIINELRGSNGFGYDPIFFSTELNKTFAEADEEEKNRLSHRGRAVQKLIDYLLENGYLAV